MIFLKELAVEGCHRLAHSVIYIFGILHNLVLDSELGELLTLDDVVDVAQPEPDTGDIAKVMGDTKLTTSVHEFEEEIGQVVVFQYQAT